MNLKFATFANNPANRNGNEIGYMPLKHSILGVVYTPITMNGKFQKN